MTKTSDHPPILAFLLAFTCLLGAALLLAALSPNPELAADKMTVSDNRGAAVDARMPGRREEVSASADR